ncbi:hypothetical protein DSO57_1022273 [Entomophthora muscae]|uniref:Uncharacterized protein n=1 Tax=Entomophthora muscae TaxID=34485 RepID=A0ACC2S516_9FUNG|nr:hypothetical protein DSO57_1022273 [Entomophthora muscae]
MSTTPHLPSILPSPSLAGGTIGQRHAGQISSSEDDLTSTAEDEILLETLANNSSSNITYTKTTTKSPVASAVEALETLSRRDLVVVGRTKLGSLDALYGAGNARVDNDRRQVLGDVAESILLSPCPCSVLIVQESLH